MSTEGVVAETIVREYNIARRRVFKQNVILKDDTRTIAEFDFIQPNLVIEVKGGESYDMKAKHSLLKVIKQFHRMKNIIPDHFKIYHFFAKKLNDQVHEYFVNHGLIIIYNLDEIAYDHSSYVYYTRDTSVIRLLGSFDEDNYRIVRERYSLIWVPKYIYLRAVVSMSNEHLNRLNQFDFHFTNDEPEKYIYLTLRRLSPDKEQLYNIFYEQLISPKEGFQYVDKMLLIDTITTICKKCKEIKYDECIDCDICSKCSGKKNNKRKPDSMLPIKSSKLKKMRFE
ncbi:hypothetical protein Klosneuvirus_3_180 [Klosneuvirus KNV1]|uniref:Uncharacterized protein n=1 Tax=Klosneuvirus KNV1 TaxID=1977640 RepID=A0A1V0SJY4_9VIRU|nr:hypothetical protein Klosneuvirus_3_180 [Klosneuvirus KNV1]